MPEFQTTFRLGRQPGEGVVCDGDGLLVGEVALLERSSNLDEAQGWRPRPQADLNRDLSRCYLTDFTPASQRLAAVYKLSHLGAIAKLERTISRARYSMRQKRGI